jgi:hypothetical protein
MRNRIVLTFFVLSLGLNAFFLYPRTKPDVAFYATGMKNAYHIKSLNRGLYTIEHDGHLFTAKCRVSVSWLDGTDKVGRPMASGECVYMPTMVGKSIAAGIMRHERDSNSLVYLPWASFDTLQTADYLTIVDGESLLQ